MQVELLFKKKKTFFYIQIKYENEPDESAQLIETIVEEIVYVPEAEQDQETIITHEHFGVDDVYEQQTPIENIGIQDEKSSSFPFGTLQTDLNALYDQSSTGIATDTDVAPTTTDSIDNFLANLAEDNANSLPSVSDENTVQHLNVIEERNDINYEKEIAQNSSDSSSLAAVAEDLPNGCSQDTKVDGLDAEMVSEDELPAPAQPKVDDAEEVSDEELPGPKLAELPADTEVVSEDELPSTNKVKRKADKGYDPCSPTESTEAPEKRIKIDTIGKQLTDLKI